ncbi:MAG: HDIG domain-containing protein [Candidatus Eisenbacteria bacterium]
MSQGEPKDPGRERFREWGRGLLVLLALLPLFPPLAGDAPPIWSLGDVAPRAVVAEFDFPVLRDRSEFDEELRRLRGEIPALLAVSDSARVSSRDRLLSLRTRVETLRATYDPSGPDSLTLGYDPETSLSLVLGERGLGLLDLLDELGGEVERRGLVSASLGRDLEPFRTVTILGAGDPVHVDCSRLLTPSTLRDSAAVVARSRRLPVGPTLALVDDIFTPNLVWQKAETERLLDEAGSAVPRHRRFVRKGEKIVGANEVVTSEVALALQSYALWQGEGREGHERWTGVVDRASRTLLAAALIALAFVLLPLDEGGIQRRHRPGPPRGALGERTLFAIVVAGALVVFFLLRGAGLSQYLLPVAGAALTARLLLGRDSGFLAGGLLATLIALPGGAGFAAWVVFALGSSVAVLVPTRSPAGLGRSAVLAAAAQAATLLALFGAGVAARRTFQIDAVMATLGPLLGGALAWAAVASVEQRARWSTPLGAAELTSLDQPLLARLQAEAPGTYAHSVRVASLADAAARAIGADGRLARAIGYLHDIGKLARPLDFPENGGDPPPAHRHHLLREMHVREGVALASEAKLPRAVVQGIAEHHGTELGAESARPSFPESGLVLIANRAVRALPEGRSGERGGMEAELETLLDPVNLLADLEWSGISLDELRTVRSEITALCRSWMQRPRATGGEMLADEVTE